MIESHFQALTSAKYRLIAFLPLLFGLGCGSNAAVIPGPLSLASSYVILAKTGVSNVTGSTITGNVGLSPAAATFLTGFSLVADSTNVFSTSSSVIGKLYAADYAVPTPTNLTAAVANMQANYTEIAGRAPTVTEHGAGNLGGLTLAPGVYKWSNSVSIDTDVTISGSATDIWVFQIAGNLTLAAAKKVILSGGALASNITWQVAGQATTGTTSIFEGSILSQTGITLQNLAVLHGRAHAQSLVALNNNTITMP